MLIVLLIVVGLVGLACAQPSSYGGTLRVAWEQDVTGFDPHTLAVPHGNLVVACCKAKKTGHTGAGRGCLPRGLSVRETRIEDIA